MKKYADRINALPLIVRVLLMNALVLLLLLIFFIPTQKCDDYEMTLILYGASQGEYSPFMLYSNIFLGYLIQGLLNLFPNIAWYYVLQYIVLFLSLTSISFVLLKESKNRICNAFVWIFLIIAGYETYIRITFTKTAGVSIIAGLLLVISLIVNGLQKWYAYIYGIFLVFIGCSYRSGLLSGMIGIFCGGIIYYLVSQLLRVYREKSADRLKKVKVIVSKFILAIVFLGCMFVMNKAQTYMSHAEIQTLEGYEDYYEVNHARAELVDYGWPNYQKYKSQYKALGISANDYKMWKRLKNVADEETLSVDQLVATRDISNNAQELGKKKIVIEAIRDFPKYILTNYIAVLFCLLCLFFIFINWKRGIIFSIIVGGTCSLCYLYLRYLGRTRHQVDFCIFGAACAILLFVLCKESKTMVLREKGLHSLIGYKMWVAAICVSLVLVALYSPNYKYLISSTYEGISTDRNFVHKNYERMSKISQDKSHLYIFGASEELTLYPCFSAFEVIPKGFYDNMFRMSQYAHSELQAPLKKYGIDNRSPLSAITDNEKVYYCVSENNKSQIDIVLKYIKEHYNDKANADLVKEFDGICVYRFVTSN